MQGANSWYGQSLYLLLRGKQCQLRMFQAGSKEQIIRFHSSILFTELLQKFFYDVPRVFFSRMCSVVLRAPDASIYLYFLSSGRKVEISMRLRSVKMNYRIIESFGWSLCKVLYVDLNTVPCFSVLLFFV